MGKVGDAVGNTNNQNAKKKVGVSTHGGGHDEANYEGVESGQGIDWDTTAQMRGFYQGIWWDSPLGHPATYSNILSSAKSAGKEAGTEGIDIGETAAGNEGQRRIIQIMGPDVINNAWHYQVNGYGSAADYIRMHCAYPSAVESIIDQIGEEIEGIESQ